MKEKMTGESQVQLVEELVEELVEVLAGLRNREILIH
jgi:hypothetical protein